MKIYSAATPPEAYIVCELLKSRHIQCEVRGEGIFGLQGEVPFGLSSEPYIWLLQPEKYSQAIEVIEQFQQSENGNEWQCRHCGETNESHFAICWQCGSSAN